MLSARAVAHSLSIPVAGTGKDCPRPTEPRGSVPVGYQDARKDSAPPPACQACRERLPVASRTYRSIHTANRVTAIIASPRTELIATEIGRRHHDRRHVPWTDRDPTSLARESARLDLGIDRNPIRLAVHAFGD